MLIEVLATILGLAWLALASGGFSGVGTMYRDMVDMPSLVAILLLTMPIFFRRGMWTDFKNAIKMQSSKFSCSLGEMKKAQYAVEFVQKQLLYAGAVTLIYGLISGINSSFDVGGQVSIVGLCIVIALICPFYAAILELIVLPLEIGVKRRIAEYMEEE